MAGSAVLPSRPFTYADYRTLPEDGKRSEILDGDLVVSPAPAPRHQAVSLYLAALLHRYVRRHRLGVAHYWIIDAKKHRPEAFAREGSSFSRVLDAGGDDVVSPPPFEKLHIALGKMWE